jgi:hypothetical protein
MTSAEPRRALDALQPLPSQQQYDVALSFAGEDREVARKIANIARSNGLLVYFDEHHLWESWGKDLSEYLGSIYGGGARYCLILISSDYCRKAYTIFERRIALARALESREEYVLPVVLDDSWPPGLPRTTGYLDLRVLTINEVAEAVIQKIRGDNGKIRPADDSADPQLKPLDQDLRTARRDESAREKLIDFADVSVASDSPGWEEGAPYIENTWSSIPSRWSFRGGLNMYPDPVLDITIINRTDAPRLVSRIGIIALGASYKAYEAFGGGGGQSVTLHRTYEIPLPDAWAALAKARRGLPRNDPKRSSWAELDERSTLRLPDPILIKSGKAYRFGLNFLDYTALCPTEVEWALIAQSDAGEARSDRFRMSYFIGSKISPTQRYQRLLYGPMMTESQSAQLLMMENYTEARIRYERIAQDAYQLAHRGDKTDPAKSPEGDFLSLEERMQALQEIAKMELAPLHTRSL